MIAWGKLRPTRRMACGIRPAIGERGRRYWGSLGEEVLKDVNCIGYVHGFVVIRVSSVETIYRWPLSKEVLEDINGVGYVHGSVKV